MTAGLKKETAVDPGTIGLYVHVPFCEKKCPYCDFYSLPAEESRIDAYTACIVKKLESEAVRVGRAADTLYFGGGTPGLLGAERLCALVEAAGAGFGLSGAEITAEVNPAQNQEAFFGRLSRGGINRVSIGLQSSDAGELARLGRRHTPEQARRAVDAARAAGIRNVSLDLMLGIPGQTRASLRRSIAFCAESGVQHVSAYLLKVEPGTSFYKRRAELDLPDEEETAALYLLACEELERYGFAQYEISNFAQLGFQSRHNLKYWHDEEYLGLGPAAHSFLDGKRSYWPRDLRGFLTGAAPVADGDGGDFEEYAMLGLRLTEGLREDAYRRRFGAGIPPEYYVRAEKYRAAGLTVCGPDGIRLTRKGFLVSNALIGEILAGSAF